MQIERDTLVPGPPERAFALVDDLARYPAWMDLVHDVQEVEMQEVAGVGDRRAWEVELRAQVGPFARSKRLRMVRTVHEPSHRAVFERSEIDGRRHSTWILAATIQPDPSGHLHHSDVAAPGPGDARLTMTLTYGGNLWTGAVLQRVLDDHVERGAAALRALLTAADDTDDTD